jgi:HK97 gp10 family phage protein
VKIEGLEELRRRFRRLPVEVQEQELSGAVMKGAAVIGRDAQERAPVLKEPHPKRTPGLLKRMIRWTRGVRRGSEASAFVSVRRPGKGAMRKGKQAGKASSEIDPWYWKFIEFGTSKMRAMPFLRPAFDAKKEAAADEIKKALAAGVERQAKKLAGRS